MLLYLARHGETTYNAEGRIQGQEDTALSELGRRQAHLLALALAEQGIEAVYSSPLARAYHTARAVAETCRIPLCVDDRLKELHAGVFQNLLASELEARFPEAAARWRSHDPDFRIPGGESRRDLMHRGRQALEAIRAAAYRRVAVVAHGGLLAAALKALLHIPAERNPFVLYNAALSILDWEGEPRLLVLNQTDHLRAVGCERSGTGEL